MRAARKRKRRSKRRGESPPRTRDTPRDTPSETRPRSPRTCAPHSPEAAPVSNRNTKEVAGLASVQFLLIGPNFKNPEDLVRSLSHLTLFVSARCNEVEQRHPETVAKIAAGAAPHDVSVQ